MNDLHKSWGFATIVTMLLFVIIIAGKHYNGKETVVGAPQSFIYKAEPYGQMVAVIFCKEDKCDTKILGDGPKDQVEDMLADAPNNWGGLYQKNIMLLRDASIRSITHEAYHATNDILKTVGVKYSTETEEVYAYLISDMVAEIANK